MEKDNITYQYSRGNCIIYSCVLLWIIFMMGPSLVNSFKNYDYEGVLFFGLLLSAPLTLLIAITIRYSIPAIRGKVAFEINQQGIIDYVRKFIIDWADITDLRMAENRGIDTIYFYFKAPDGSEDYIRTRLMWVEGNDMEIYGIIEANLEERGPHKS